MPIHEYGMLVIVLKSSTRNKYVRRTLKQYLYQYNAVYLSLMRIELMYVHEMKIFDCAWNGKREPPR